MTDEERYELVCSKSFKELGSKADETLLILKGSNGQIGLCEQVRAIKKAYRAVVGAAVFILSIFSIQLIIWMVEGLKKILSG